MYSIRDDIENGKFKPVYLLFGEERFLVNLYRDKLVTALMKKTVPELEGDMNFSHFTGTGTDIKAVEESVRTMPFFSERRLVLVEGSDWFKKQPDGIADLISDVPESTCLIFTELNVDKKTSAFHAVQKKGHAADFVMQSEEAVQNWILRNVDQNNKLITKGAVKTLLQSVGPDLAALSTELEKLYSYCLDKEAISKEDVEALVHVKATDHVFDMIDNMARKRPVEALKLYDDLLELRTPPAKILSLMERQFRILIAVKDLRPRGLSVRQMAERLGLNSFAVEKSISQSNQFSMEELKLLLKRTAEYDRQVKLSSLSDRMAVELVLVDIANRE